MSRLLLSIIFCLQAFLFHSQSDSTSVLIRRMIAPGVLMSTGIVLSKNSIKSSIQQKIQTQFPGFHSTLDDYFQYTPSAMNVIAILID